MAVNFHKGLPSERQEFIQAFSEEELGILMNFISRQSRLLWKSDYPQSQAIQADTLEGVIEKIRSFIQANKKSKFFCRLVSILAIYGFESSEPIPNLVVWCIQNISTIKHLMNRTDLPEVQWAPDRRRLAFEKLQAEILKPISGLVLLNHPQLGTVRLTHHAWWRFIERIPDIVRKPAFYYSKDWLFEKLSEWFASSRPEELVREYRVKRVLTNRHQPARYFVEPSAGLRFVVSEENPPALLTCEIPR